MTTTPDPASSPVVGVKSPGRFFVWGPQWFYSWPIKVLRGEDEYGWRTLGVVTWAGSLFFRTSKCYLPECVKVQQTYTAPRQEDSYGQL